MLRTKSQRQPEVQTAREQTSKIKEVGFNLKSC